MDAPVPYLTCETIENVTAVQMTEQQYIDQLVGMIYGNVHVEHAGVTLELARKVVQERIAAGTLDGIFLR